MSLQRAIALKELEPGEDIVRWTSVLDAIRNSDITDVADVPMPYMQDVTIGQFVDQLTRGEPLAQKEKLDFWMSAAVTEFDKSAAMIHLISDIVQKTPNLVAQYGGMKNFNIRYPAIRTATDYNEKKMTEMASAIKFIRENDDGKNILVDIVTPYCPQSAMEHATLSSIAFCIRRLDANNLVEFINSAMYRRLSNPRKKKDKFCNSSDWVTVRQALNIFHQDTMNFIMHKDNENHPLVAEAKTLGKSAPKPKATEWEVCLVGDSTSKVYRWWAKALSWWKTEQSPAAIFNFNGVRTPFLLKPRITADWVSANGMKFGPGNFLIPIQGSPEYIYGRVQTMAPSASPSRSQLLTEPGSSMRAAGRTSIPPGGSSLTPTRPWSGTRPFPMDSEYPGGVVESIERDRRSSLSTVASTDLDQMAFELGVDTTRKQRRTIEAIRDHQQSKGTRLGSVASVPEDHRNKEQSTIRPSAFRSAQDVTSQEVDYPSASDAQSMQEEAEIGEEVMEDIRKSTKCKCTNNRSAFVLLCTKIGQKLLKDPERVKLLDAWIRECCEGGGTTREKGPSGRVITYYTIEPSRICFPHSRYAAGKLGLLVRTLNTTMISNLLVLMYKNKSKWGKWRSDPKTRILFQEQLRAPNTLDSLQSYRFRPVPAVLNLDWDDFIAKHPSQHFQAKKEELNRKGTIVVPMFSSMFQNDPELRKIVDDCFNMYDYHTRMKHGKSNLGWCRIMYHSVIQQLIRGDLQYWLHYAVLRRETNLISYPYYTKYTKPGDQTAFKHVDCNLSDVVESGRGVDMIQGSVSLNDEDKDNCTIALEGFHKAVPEYLNWREENGIERRNGYIEGWVDAVDYPKSAQTAVGAEWEKYPCKYGDVRISHPILPHGSTGPATKVRRTILPWYVLVTEDGETMEIPEMGSYKDIASSHQMLTPGPSSPSGHSNKYGGAPYAFPADMSPSFTSWIAKAIHCQAHFNSYAVQQEIVKIFSLNDKELTEFLQQSRADNVNMVKKHWKWVRHAEKFCFRADKELGIPDRSFFSNKGVIPEHKKGWENWDGQHTQGDALDTLFGGLTVKAAESTVWKTYEVSGSPVPVAPRQPPGSPTPGPSGQAGRRPTRTTRTSSRLQEQGSGKGKERAE